jgi:hypothetical protein
MHYDMGVVLIWAVSFALLIAGSAMVSSQDVSCYSDYCTSVNSDPGWQTGVAAAAFSGLEL